MTAFMDKTLLIVGEQVLLDTRGMSIAFPI